MALLTFFYKNGLWLSWLVCGLGVCLLWFFILNVVSLGDRNQICNLPLEAEQKVEFIEAGRVVLWLEGPQLTTRFASLNFELTGPDGSIIKSSLNPFRKRFSGLSKVRITDRVFTIPYPGHYILHSRGMETQKTVDEKHRLIFMRPHLTQTRAYILGIVLGALLTIGGIVNFFIRLSAGGSS